MIEHDRRLTPARSDLAAERLRWIVSAERYVAGNLRQVVWPSAPVRRGPRRDAALDTEALMGETVTVYEEAEGWSWVQLAQDGYVGYVPSEALCDPTGPVTHRVVALRTFVYPGPDLKLPPDAHLSLGAEASVMTWTGGYARLRGGGYVWGDHLAPMAHHAPDFVAVAERLVGTPYLWGGKTSLGLDCSALVQLSLAMTGQVVPRDTDMQQAGIGRAVEIAPGLAGMERGDLVFWRGHVGIMLDESRLIHANGHHMAVAIERLAEAEARILHNSYGAIAGLRRLPGA